MKSGDLVASRTASTCYYEMHPEFGLIVRTMTNKDICIFICMVSRGSQLPIAATLNSFPPAMIMRPNFDIVYVDPKTICHL